MKKVLRFISLCAVGALWSMSANAQITTFPHFEDFETFAACGGSCTSVCGLQNGWVNAATATRDYSVDAGGTSSSLTGPSVDYSPGTPTGKYLYAETSSPCYSGTNTWHLVSPTIDLTGTNDVQFTFWYHMYGQSMGTAHVDVSNDGGTTWTLDVVPAWTDDVDLWQEQVVSLGAWTGQVVNVRIRYQDPTNFYGDFALDAIYIYDLLQDDAGIAAFVDPATPTCNFNDSVNVTLTNFGTDTLFTANINWEWNTIAQPVYSWTGALAGGESETVYLGSVSYTNGNFLKAYTSVPNGVNEIPSGAGNDTTLIMVQSGLSGVYTIGATGDYLTFNAAIADLNTYGVCDDVTFNVQDGVYNEQITLIEVIGMNDTNTVTFQSISGDPNLCVLNYDATLSTDNYVIFMDGGDHFAFRDLGLLNLGTTYGTVLNVANGANYNTWEGNIFGGDPNNATTSTNKALVYSSGSLDSMNVFDGNDFMYGSYQMYWYGGGTTSLENGTKIINNNFQNGYYMGIRTYYQNNVEIGGNVINPGVNYTGSIYRIYMGYNDGASRVYGNQLQGNKYGYGIYMTLCDGNFSESGLIYNNFVHVGDSTSTSTSYGIYMTSSNYQILTHNSINMDSDGTSSRGIYVTSGGNNVVRNNAIQNTGPGYGFYYVSGVSECDYNNVYAPNGNLYYFGANINNLNTWQNATGFGMMSDTLDPMFVGSDDLHTCALGLDGAAMADTLVMYDIDGDMRDANTPDIGADEYLVPGNVSFDSDSIWKCSQDAVTLGGWTPSSGATFQWSTFETTPTISAANPGTYTVNILNSCGSGSPSVEVVNYPDPSADFTLNQSFLTAEVSSTSTGTFDTYLWDMGDGSTYTTPTVIHVYADTGYYTITLTVTGICGSDSYTQTMYSNLVGVDELSMATSLNVYPNPSKGEFTISMNLNESAEVSASITDLQGKVVWNSAYGEMNGSIEKHVNLAGQSSGMYLLKVSVDGATSIRRIVVE